MADTDWDVVVIGGGPGGSAAALSSAAGGLRVVMIDGATFPRHKACGCCLAPSGLRALGRLGAGARMVRLGGARLASLELGCGGRRAWFPLRGGVAVSREAMDVALHGAARAAGVVCRFGERARVVSDGSSDGLAVVEVGGDRLAARLVVIADGLSGRAAGSEASGEGRWSRAPRGRVGASAVLGVDASDAMGGVAPGVVRMDVAAGGYVGRARLEDGRVVVAAALDPGGLRRGPGEACAEILQSSGLWEDSEAVGAAAADWKVTPRLTRRRRRAWRGRCWFVGDSAGYVEPFTGEGMSWALEQGEVAGALAAEQLRGAGAPEGRAWDAALRGVRGVRSARCGMVAGLMRRPRLLRGVLGVAAVAKPLRTAAAMAVQGSGRGGGMREAAAR